MLWSMENFLEYVECQKDYFFLKKMNISFIVHFPSVFLFSFYKTFLHY